MELKMKSNYEILLKILRKDFMKDLRAGNLCATDQLGWLLKDEQTIEEYFCKWLINEEYAEKRRSKISDWIEMPSHINMHNGTHERCDMLIGTCACGATHSIKDWKDKIPNAEQYIKRLNKKADKK